MIRFKGISREDFFDKIKPYSKIFDKEIYEELLRCYFFNTWQSKSLTIPQNDPRRLLLNLQTKKLISSWIDDNKDYDNNNNNVPYKFELILRGSHDGFSKSVFEDKCFDIRETVFIMNT